MKVRLVLNRSPEPIEGDVHPSNIGQGLGIDVTVDGSDDGELFVPWTSIAYLVRDPKPIDPDKEPF